MEETNTSTHGFAFDTTATPPEDYAKWMSNADAQERNRMKIAEMSESASVSLSVIGRRLAAMGLSFSDDDHPFKPDDENHSDYVKMAVHSTMTKAKRRLGIKHDWQLREALGLTEDQFKKRKSNPSTFRADEALRLCELAHVTLREARGETANSEGMASVAYLLDSDQWSAEDVANVFEDADEDSQKAVVYALRSWLRGVFRA